MEKHRIEVGLLVALLLVVSMGVATPAHAQASDGMISVEMSKALYCSVAGLLQGNIGLLLGIILVFSGLWSMILGAKIIVAAPLIVIGALITALPNIVENTFVGLGNLLQSSHMAQAGFDPPICTTKTEAIIKNYSQYQRGSFYPKGREPLARDVCPPGAGGSVCM